MVDGGVAIEPLYQVIDHHLADIVSNSWLYFGEADVSSGQMLSNNFEFKRSRGDAYRSLRSLSVLRMKSYRRSSASLRSDGTWKTDMRKASAASNATRRSRRRGWGS